MFALMIVEMFVLPNDIWDGQNNDDVLCGLMRGVVRHVPVILTSDAGAAAQTRLTDLVDACLQQIADSRPVMRAVSSQLQGIACVVN